jgi:hypothetical protein
MEKKTRKEIKKQIDKAIAKPVLTYRAEIWIMKNGGGENFVP